MEGCLTPIVFVLRTVLNTVVQENPTGMSLCESLCSPGCGNYTCINYNLTYIKDMHPGNVQFMHLKKGGIHGKRSVQCSTGSDIVLRVLNKHVCLETKLPPKLTTPNYRLQKLRAKGYKEVRWKEEVYLHKHYKDMKPWSRSRKKCEQDGGILMQLKEEFKWKLIEQSMETPKDFFKWGTWVGLRYIKEWGRYEWLDSSPMLDKRRWNGGRIGHKKGFFSGWCVALKKVKSKFLLSNYNCKSKSRFLCEVSTNQNM